MIRHFKCLKASIYFRCDIAFDAKNKTNTVNKQYRVYARVQAATQAFKTVRFKLWKWMSADKFSYTRMWSLDMLHPDHRRGHNTYASAKVSGGCPGYSVSTISAYHLEKPETLTCIQYVINRAVITYQNGVSYVSIVTLTGLWWLLDVLLRGSRCNMIHAFARPEVSYDVQQHIIW